VVCSVPISTCIVDIVHALYSVRASGYLRTNCHTIYSMVVLNVFYCDPAHRPSNNFTLLGYLIYMQKHIEWLITLCPLRLKVVLMIATIHLPPSLSLSLNQYDPRQLLALSQKQPWSSLAPAAVSRILLASSTEKDVVACFDLGLLA
jgi:hypothetical protein